MKRKIFSKLLMVAMLVASVSMFVSCKDYDDDIKKNSDAISSLQQTLNNLQSALDQAKSDAATAHATFATKVELGQVDTAVKALQEEIKALATKTALEDAIAKVSEAIGKNATKEELAELSSMVAAINTDLDAIGEWQKTTDDAIKTANENIGKQEEALAALALVVAAGDQTNADAIAALKTALEKAIKDGDKANSDAIAALKTALEKSIAEGDNTNATAIAALEEVVGTKADAKALTDAVKELKEAIATKANQSALDALSKLVDAKATIASVDELKAALTEKIADAVTELENVKKTMATASDINDIKDAMKKADEAIKKNLDAINLLQVFIAKRLTSLVFIPDLYLDGIEAVEVKSVKDSILALVDANKRQQVTEVWGVLLSDKKTVAVPDTAIAKWYREPNATTSKTWNESTFRINGQSGASNVIDWTKKAPAYWSYYPLAEAKYHVNPTTANLDGAELSFYVNTPEVKWNYDGATRADGDALATPVPAKIEKTSDFVDNGIITVPFKVDRTLLNAVRYKEVNDEVTYTDHEAFIALQATVKNEAGNDTTVTSDYALLYPSDIDIVALGGKWMHNIAESHWFGSDHLWTRLLADNQGGVNCPIQEGCVLYTAGSKVVNGQNVPYYSPIKDFKKSNVTYTLQIPYNSTGVNLNEQVLTHIRRGYVDKNGKFIPAPESNNWQCVDELTADELAAYGLHYEFEAIHYISGSNMTDEYEHIALSGEKGCIAKPMTVTSDGKQDPNAQAGRETIGRMPIVRANLVNEDGDVLMIGYILIEIVDENIDIKDIVIDLPKAYMNCTAPAAITWAQVEDQILKQIQLSKTEFEALYYLETIELDDNHLGNAKHDGDKAYNADHSVDPTTATKGLDGRFYSKEGYATTSPATAYPGNYGDAILYQAVDAATKRNISGFVGATAVQYKKINGKWQSIYDLNKALLANPNGAAYKALNNSNESNTSKRAAAAAALLYHPLGSVYEHVNTEGQQTTVLEWNVGSEVDGGVAGTGASESYADLGAAVTAITTEVTSTARSTVKNQPRSVSTKYAMSESGASVASEGVSTEPIEVTVAFKQKDAARKFISTNAIYVTLRINAGDLYFAYAKVAGKDLSLWYKMNSWQNADNGTDADEIHLNVPTPGKAGFTKPLETTLYGWAWTKPDAKGEEPLHGDLFYKQIATTFKNAIVAMDGLDETNFSKFKNTTFSYNLVDPATAGAQHITVAKQQLSGANNTKAPAEPVDKSWKVNGVSGAEYLLYVQNDFTDGDKKIDVIRAAAWINPVTGNAVSLGNVEIARLVVTSTEATVVPKKQTSIVYANNPYAQDILNYAGRLNKAGSNNDLQRVDGEYLTRENKAFTAFISIKPNSSCYNLLMPNSYFRARWLRPINVVDGDKKWVDANNEVQVANAAELVKVFDWRTYTVTAAQTDKQTNVHAPYYEINDSTYRHFFIDFDGIRTDHDLGAASAERKLDPNQEIEIEKLTLAKDLPSLNAGNGFFKCEYNATTKKLELKYKNGGANVGVFHFYVPVYVCYAFGDYWMKGDNSTIGVIHKPSRAIRTAANYPGEIAETEYAYATDISAYNLGTPGTTTASTIFGEGWKPIFTQKVYAVITVDQTHQSHTGDTSNTSGARNK